VSLSTMLGPGVGALLGTMSSLLILSSPPLSLFNLVLKRIESPYPDELVLGVEFRTVYGVPVPVPTVIVSRRTTTLCVNLGGGLVPVIVSSLFLYAIHRASGGFEALFPAFASVAVTSVVTFISSRAIPGVGIVVPTFIPPVASSLTVLALIGPGPLSGLSAYIGGSLGSLIGADVLRLLRDYKRINSPLLSIGGAGVFDGVFISGILGLLLAL
ncbi:MAG: DUF1614 domain-containing protein, partial [Desulfurococcales archaeon]|nr:DUF1614 domain-containing protein [Desulfurococcales archaeon]